MMKKSMKKKSMMKKSRGVGKVFGADIEGQFMSKKKREKRPVFGRSGALD